MQLTAKRLKIAEEGTAPNSTENASSSQTSLQKDDQTTIQNNHQKQEPSTSKSNDTANNENNLQISVSDVNIDVVRQLNSLLKRSTSEFDELKVLLKKYLKTEKTNRSPRSDKNVKFTLTDQDDDTNTKKKPDKSASNSSISLTSLNDENRKKLPKEPRTRQMDIEKISKNTKAKKCELSDISESNEMERNSSSSDVIKKKPSVPEKNQNKTYSKKGPSICRAICNRARNSINDKDEMERNSSSSDVIKSKRSALLKNQNKKGANSCRAICNRPPNSKNDKQSELVLNIISKSSSSLLSTDEDKRTHIRDFIDKPPKDSNDLTNPPNTVRSAPPEKKSYQNCIEPKKDIGDKKKSLEVQILPPLDIRRSLITQKLPDVAIESIEDFFSANKVASSENVKYIQIMHGSDIDLPKEETPEIAKPVDESDNIVPSQSKDTCPNECSNKADSPTKSKITDVKINEIYFAHQQILSSSDDFSRDDVQNKMPPITANTRLENVPEERRTVSEELNLDIENLPSVRTLKVIQTFLEQKCALIRSRLQEESKLQTGETLSLRYKLSQPPLWQSSIAEQEPESNHIIPEQNPKAITLSPLKTYSSLKSPLSPLQKHDKSQQIKSNPSLISTPNPKSSKTSVKYVDKSLQVSISENMDLPVARRDNTCYSSQFSAETSNKDIHETKEAFTTPSISLTSPKTSKKHNENSDSIPQISVQTQKDNFKVICLPRDTAINTNLLEDITNTQLEGQVTNKALTATNKCSDVSTQINEFDYVKQPAKKVSFEIVTTQVSLLPKENKETQISQLDLHEKMTKTRIEKEKKENIAVEIVKKEQCTTCKDEKTQTVPNEMPIIKEKEAPIVRYIQSNATQTVNVKDKITTCNMKTINEQQEKPQMKSPSMKETKECCTQYSPVRLQQDLDATEYKTLNSFRNVDRPVNDEQSKRVYFTPGKEHRCYYKSHLKNKRTLQRRKVCSTPVSPSSISTSETMSISDGEVKLSCECSTSIGEIHLCRFANNIRKKVKILKQNPEELFKESFRGTNFKIKRQHKYNDNWFAYYVTKTESSSEHGTGSNLSSIKSNIETE